MLKRREILTSSEVAATFAFVTSQGHVGEKLVSQLVVSSRAHELSAPIVLKHINLMLKGSLRSIRIVCDCERTPESRSGDGLVQMYSIPLQNNFVHSDGSSSAITGVGKSSQLLGGFSDLTFPPGATKVFSFETVPRESGEIELMSATMYLEEEAFEFEVMATSSDHLRQHDIWIEKKVGLSKKKTVGQNSLAVKILPRPPKIRIEVKNLAKAYLTDELVVFEVHITNNEEADAEVELQGHLLGLAEASPSLRWHMVKEVSKESEQGIKDERLIAGQGEPSIVSLGVLNAKETKETTLSFQAGSEASENVLKIDALYHLLTDPDTIISKSFEAELVFEKPFEANYIVLPRVHPSPWPSYFSAEEDQISDTPKGAATVARGIRQNWSLAATVASIATEAVDVEDVRLELLEPPSDVSCRMSEQLDTIGDASDSIEDSNWKRRFDLEVQKFSLDDRRSTKLKFQLQIEWRRKSIQTTTTISHIAVPELIIPFGEPRVLASAHSQQGKVASIHLDYVIENPSMYVLTFNVSMETNDEFAFSGPKATSIQLVPLSRHTIRYIIYPLIQGTWITPLFRVVDPYFNKTLKVHATEGLRNDPEGLHIWADAED